MNSITESDEERVIWEGSPSQLSNFPVYLFLLLVLIGGTYLVVNLQHYLPHEYMKYRFSWMPVVFLYGVVKWLGIRMTRFELTSQRFKKSRGILLRQCDEMELYRVRDYKLKRPLHLLILGYGNIELETSDRSHPTLLMPAIRRPKQVLEQLRQNVEVSKHMRGVRELDVGQ